MDLPPSEDEDEYASDSDGEGMGGAFGALAMAPDSLCYKSCRVGLVDGGTQWLVEFGYSFVGGPETWSSLRVPRFGAETAASVRRLFAPCGLVVLCWHWMATPCRLIESRVLALDDWDVTFWVDFYREAFAEFAAVNGLDASTFDVEVRGAAAEDEDEDEDERVSDVGASAPAQGAPRLDSRPKKRALCGLGGGKDSLVARFLAARQPSVDACDWVYVDDGGGEYDHSRRLQGIVAASGAAAIVLRHDFGYDALARRKSTRAKPCGHPWAALVAFDTVAAARVHGYDAVVVGNERSAAYGNGVFVGDVEVNHQFDKSLAWEKRFREYFAKGEGEGGAALERDASSRAIRSRVDYFSPLQALWDVQIAAIFSLEVDLEPYWGLFRSCNDSGDCDEWCGNCDKCAFVFLVTRAFRPKRDVDAVFAGKDLFDDETLLDTFDALATDDSAKPFECVGTSDEAALALELARLRLPDDRVPYVLAALPTRDVSKTLHLLDDVDPDAYVPDWWDAHDLLTLDSMATLRDLKATLQRPGAMQSPF